MPKKIKLNKKYRAIYNKWGFDEQIQFTPLAVDLDNENVFTILPMNNIVSVGSGNRTLIISTEEYSGELFLCSKYMRNLREIKQQNTT